MKVLSHIISTIFSPLLMPTYAVIIAMFCTMLSLTPLTLRWSVSLFIWGITCVLPVLCIYLLYRLKFLSDVQLNNQKERMVPYIITGLSYLASAFFLWRSHAPAWLALFMMGGALAVVIDVIVNRWWKISAHGSATGGVIALCFRIMNLDAEVNGETMQWVAIGVIIVAGLVGTARLLLERHTLGQVLAGNANGFLCVYFITAIN